MDNRLTIYDIGIFCMFFAVAYLQNRYVGFYHDDYGYAALSYARNEPIGQFSFENLLKYLHWHYLYWGGRIVFFFFGIIAMQFEMQGFMFIQSCIVALTLFISYRIVLFIVEDRTLLGKIYASTFFLVLYLSIKFWIYRDSMFWATASVLYVWPMLCLVGGIYILLRALASSKIGCFTYCAACSCFFMAGASQEQIGLASVVTVPCILWVFYRQAQNKMLILLTFMSAVIGFVILYAAPGNYVRMVVKGEPMPTLGAILSNFPENSLFILRGLGTIGTIILGAACVCICTQALKGNVTARKNILFLCAAAAAASIVYVAPIKGARLLFPSALLLSLATAVLLTKSALLLLGSVHTKKIMLGCVILILVAASVHAHTTWYGYYANYPVVLANDQRLRALSQLSGNIEEIYFYKVHNLQFAGSMPYDNRPYIEPWIRQYYKLPQDAPFVYEDFPVP